MLVVKEKEVAKLSEQLQALQVEGQKNSAGLEAAEQHFKAVSAGLSTNEDGEEATLAGQMMACKNDMSKADTEAKQVKNRNPLDARPLDFLQTCCFTHFHFCTGPNDPEACPGRAEDQTSGGEEDGRRLQERSGHLEGRQKQPRETRGRAGQTQL